MLIHQDESLSPFVKSEIDDILKRLMAYEPIQYITGEARFHGMNLKVKPGVLIPREETDELVDLVIDENKNREDLEILDVCSGSGAIAIALARNLPFSKVTGVDFSPVAIEMANENAILLKTKVSFLQEDIFDWSPVCSYDIIVSNPPYVLDKESLNMEPNVLDYEPHEAIFVRDDEPLVFYERIADIAKGSLKQKGRLYFEINPLTSEPLKNMIDKKGFDEVNLLKDSFGKTRFLTAVKN